MGKRKKSKLKFWGLLLGIPTVIGGIAAGVLHYNPSLTQGWGDDNKLNVEKTHNFSIGVAELFEPDKDFTIPNGWRKGKTLNYDSNIIFYRLKFENHNIENFDPYDFIIEWDVPLRTSNKISGRPDKGAVIDWIEWHDQDYIYISTLPMNYLEYDQSKESTITAKQLYYKNTAKPIRGLSAKYKYTYEDYSFDKNNPKGWILVK